MNKQYIERLKTAYESYNLDSTYGVTTDVLNYIKTRIETNKEDIQKLLEVFKENAKFEDVLDITKKTIEEENIYKSQINLNKVEENFVKTKYMTSVGLIIVETSEILEVIKYFINAIKSRNVIVISDKEYKEYDVKNYILMIIREALKKYNIDENIIDIYPYMEAEYTFFDKAIIIDGKKEKVTKKEENNKMYMYIEDEYFREKISKEDLEKYEVIKGEIDEVITKINEEICKGAVIYTRDTKKAYKFINLLHSQNVFVNTSLENIQEKIEDTELLYMTKNIIYELKPII